MALDFSLLQQPDFARAALGGYQAGKAIGDVKRREAALSLYATDPDAGIQAATAFDPVLGGSLAKARREQQTYDRETQLRSDLAGAYDATTGKVDPTKARAAYVKSGDIEGAMDFDKSEAANRKTQLESALKQVEATNQLLGTATDPATYASARAQAQSLGLDISGVPEQYDPQWVQATRMKGLEVKDQLAAQLAREKFEEDKRHAGVMEGVAQGNLAVRQRAVKKVESLPATAALGTLLQTAGIGNGE